MSKEKGCKCCKQIWYVDMLDKKLKLCPNCYEYCKPLFDDLKIKDKQIAKLEAKLAESEKSKEINIKERDKICLEMATDYNRQIIDLQSQLAITEKALELACKELIDNACIQCNNCNRYEMCDYVLSLYPTSYFIEEAKEMLGNE